MKRLCYDQLQDSLLSRDLYYQICINFEMLPRESEQKWDEKRNVVSI